MANPFVVFGSEGDRRRFLARAERWLDEGHVLVAARSLIGRRRAFRTLPVSRCAELVARDRPLVLPGGLTSITSYYHLPASELSAIEQHFDGGVLSHAYDILLRPACRGRRPAA